MSVRLCQRRPTKMVLLILIGTLFTMALMNRFSVWTMHVRKVSISGGLGQHSQDNDNLPSLTMADARIVPSKRWVVVSTDHDNNDTLGYSGSSFAFLDKLSSWATALPVSLPSSRHGCKSCHRFHYKTASAGSKLVSAFLGAILNGAKDIYVMSSVHNVKVAIGRMNSVAKTGMIYSGDWIFNPCSFFAQPLFGTNRTFGRCFDRNWLYSFKVGDFAQNQIISTCEACDSPSVAFRGGAIYCDPSTPNVQLPVGALAKFTFRNSFWSYNSFWALFFYILQDGYSAKDKEALWFSYIVQRLLWEVHTTVTFVRSNGLYDGEEFCNLRNPDHFQEEDVIDTVCQYVKNDPTTEQLIQHLRYWMCPTQYDIVDCTVLLFHDLLPVSFVTDKHVSMVENFFFDLTETGYIPPPRKSARKHGTTSVIASKAKRILFWPSSQYRIWSQDPFKKLCAKFQIDSKPLPKHGVAMFREPPLKNIVLIIVFKSNDAATEIQMSQFFDFMYGRHFRHVMYCGADSQMIDLFAKMYPQPMNVVDLSASDPNVFPYACISEVMKMNHHGVKGYLQLNSDALLNPWSVWKLSRQLDRPWLARQLREASLDKAEVLSPLDNASTWPLWNNPVAGRTAFKSALLDFQYISKTIVNHMAEAANGKISIDIRMVQYLQRYNAIVVEFLNKVQRKGPIENAVVQYGISEFFYVPFKYREHFMVLADQLYRFRVNADLAIPTILTSIAPRKEGALVVPGSVTMTTSAFALVASYKIEHLYLFPWHLYMSRDVDRRNFLCQVYLPTLEDSLQLNQSVY